MLAQQAHARRLHAVSVCGASGQYGLVIDAGSSGTRLRIYCWQPVGWGTLPKISDVLERESDDLDITLRRRPGLSAFVLSPDQAVAQVLSLVAEARQWVPDDRAASALLYVKATAGLRLLPVLQAELLLAAVGRSLSNRTLCPFSFVEARVISGEEEALFGWLSANALLGRLDRAAGAHSDTVAWLDLGGASAQLAHALLPGSTTSEESAAHVLALASSHVRLVLRSHLRFGRDEAFWRSCRLLARRAAASARARERQAGQRAGMGAGDNETLALPHPCLHPGDTFAFRFEREVHGAGAGMGQGAPQLTQIDFFGTGDAAACQEVVGVLVHQEDDCPPGRCGKLTKPFLGTYYGAGNYYYVARLLQLASHSGTVFLSANDFATAAHRACAVPWLQTRAGWNASSWMHVRFGCFSGLYISGLLQHEYGFPRAAKRLAIAHTLRDAKVEWALGSLLHEIALKGPTVELIPDAAGWLPRCRAMLSSTGMVPLWCLLPLSWAVTIGLVTWVVGCACLHRRISSRHGGVHGGKRLEYTGGGAPSLPVSPLLSPSRAELSYFDAR